MRLPWFGHLTENLVVGLWFLSFFPALAEVPVNRTQVDPLNHCKRNNVQLMESNGKVYMYGGQIWFRNGTHNPYSVANHFLRIVDFTFARDISDKSILSIKDIPDTVTIFQNGAYWVDSNRIYVVGGIVADSPWIDSNGNFLKSNYSDYRGGSVFTYNIEADKWAVETALQPNNGSTVTDSFACGSFAYNDVSQKAYCYSGTNYAGTRIAEPGATPFYVGPTVPNTVGNHNLLTFDTPSFKWTNETTSIQSAGAPLEYAQLVFLPGTKSSNGGVAVEIGGRRFRKGTMETMRQVAVYDSATDSWYNQATTVESGDDYPPGRMNFCAVGTSAPDNSSHNIYMYGGESPNTPTNAYSDMWILSLPTFHWMRVKVDSPARKWQGCTAVGQRFMLTYGGLDAGYEDGGKEGGVDTCDEDNHGLRLFDMSNLAWTARYDGPPAAGQNAYTVPKAVYNAIGGNEKGSATATAPKAGFETPALAALFHKASSTLSSGGGIVEPPPKKTNVGAIAGGVVGGVAAVAIILVGVLLLLRRKKKQRRTQAAAPVSFPEGEIQQPSMPEPQIGELPASEGGQEGKRGAHEIYSSESQAPQELDAGHLTQTPEHQRFLSERGS